MASSTLDSLEAKINAALTSTPSYKPSRNVRTVSIIICRE